MRRVHLDHNATTPMRPEVREHFLARLDALGGNPSSVHLAGRTAKAWLDEARERTAAALAVHEDEIVFTSGGTEADNLAVLGAVRAARAPSGKVEGRSAAGPRSLLTTQVEHSAVLGAAAALEAEGHPIVRFPVDREGAVDIDAFLDAVRAGNFALVSAMAANNEVGTVLPLERIGAGLAALGKAAPLFHTDAVQALGRIPVSLAAWRVDLASFSAHKVGGPLGVGILYKRKGAAIAPLLVGGGQEAGLRPGTENVPAISAAALAIELAVREQDEFAARTRALSCSFWDQLQLVLPGVVLNGPPIDAARRLPNTLNLSFERAPIPVPIDGRVLVMRLDLEGLEVSAGSACSSGSLEPSHVLVAMGRSHELARAALRVSLGRTTSDEDIHTAVEILGRTFRALR